MILKRWRSAALTALTLLAIGVAVSTAEKPATVDQTQRTAAGRTNAQADRAGQSQPVDKPTPELEVTTIADEGLAVGWRQVSSPGTPAPSLQTGGYERRDQHRARREAQPDAVNGRYGYLSPEMGSYERTMDLYQNALRQHHRRQRDYARQRHDSWLDTMCPWSQPQRNRSRIRSYRMQMEQRDRQAARDAWFATGGYAFPAPVPWQPMSPNGPLQATPVSVER